MESLQTLKSMCTNLLNFLSLKENKLEVKCDRASDTYSAQKDKEFKGTVTYLNNGMGLINDNVKFDSTDFKNITIGSKVKGIAHKEYTNWKVIILEMEQDEHNKQVEAEDQQNWDESSSIVKKANVEREAPRSKTENIDCGKEKHDDSVPFRAIVNSVYGDTLVTTSKHTFSISSCEVTYPIQKGDLVMIWYLVEDEKEDVIPVRRIEYIRSKTFLAQVTTVNKRYYIFDYKIYCDVSLYEKLPLSIEKFFVVAVESHCDLDCNWRVVSVKPDYGKEYSPHFEFLPAKVDNEPTTSLLHHILPQLNINSTKITEYSPVIEFNVMENITLTHLYNTKVFPLTIKFVLGSPIVMTGIFIRSSNDIKQISVDKGSTEKAMFPVTIGSSCECMFTLSCTAKLMGASSEKIVATFDQMSAFKNINIMIGSIDADVNADHITAIKGVKPYRAKRFLPKKLPEVEIPKDLLTAVETNDFGHYKSLLNSKLIADNFLQKLRLCLFLEEIHKKYMYKTYVQYKIGFSVEAEYLVLNLNWTEDCTNTLIVGDKVHVFPLDHSQHHSPMNYYEGYIHFLHSSRVLIKFKTADFNYLKNLCCRVEFIHSRTPFKKCHMGLNLVLANYGTSSLFPTTLPTPNPPQASFLEEGFAIVRNPLDDIPDDKIPILEWINSRLNAEQKNAIRSILTGSARPLPYVIFGPPGTGKTITVVEAITQIYLLVPHSRILVVAPSNSACDLLAERLVNTNVYDSVQMARLNGFNRNKNTIPKSIFDFSCDVSEILNIMDCRVIVCTTVTSASLYEVGLMSDHFTHLFLDEAGQMTDAESSIPLGFLNKQDGQVILAGDPMQLGPVVMSPIAKRYGYGQSMLSRLCDSPLYAADYTVMKGQISQNATRAAMDASSLYDSRLITLLVRSYRSNAQLIHLPSLLFYHGTLVAPQFRREDQLYQSWSPMNKAFPIFFYGIQGVCTASETGSRENYMEANAIAVFVQSLLQHGIPRKEIAVITPYRQQVKLIIKLLTAYNFGSIDVGSVEKFQGQERGVILLSTVRSYTSHAPSNSSYDIGFVSSPERFNVAITRAKSLLVVVGDPTVLELNYHWRALISYCHQNRAFADTRGLIRL